NLQLAYEAALVYTVIGDRASALANAQRALTGGFDPRWFTSPFFDAQREVPAWQDLLAAAETRVRSGSAAR
ncbi:MAG: hypothetical protein HC897_18820, partial [Thermoanaerobaculia bacterium]|nr:hypothetical protein [Thermoanaerobaculia bacterium]